MRSPRFSVSCVIALAITMVTPAAAQQPNAYPITNVNLRAGPGIGYPIILTVPADAPITILGCLPDYTWCDSVFQNYRGWMRSIYLSGYYEGDYYLLRDYAPRLGYRSVTFSINAYWDSYYRDEPFYSNRSRWADRYEEGWVDEAVFYDRLSPYGSWIWIQGQYVWVPARVDRDWRPYTRGRWIYTNRGWTWVSNEPFGWATYHYGRWGFSDRVGWFWVPGNQWAPAWVSWRQSDEYLAWAPLPPSHDRGGISINISFGDLPDYYWSVVPSHDFLSDDLPRYYVRDRDRRRPALERTRPIGHTTIINNKTIVNNVINVTYVEQTTNTQVVERQIATTSNVEEAGKMEGDVVEVYQPAPEETPAALAPPEPKTVEEVSAESETKDQAEGEETTEEMLTPPEVQDAAKERKGKGRKGKAKAGAEDVAPEDSALPEGKIADGPPPADAEPKQEPVPAEEIAVPKAAEPKQPVAAPEEQPEVAPKEPVAAPDETPATGPKAKSKERKKPKDVAPEEEPEVPEVHEPQPAATKDEAPTAVESPSAVPPAEEEASPAEPKPQPQETKPKPKDKPKRKPAAPKAKEMKPTPKPKPAPVPKAAPPPNSESQAPGDEPKPSAPPPEPAPETNAPPQEAPAEPEVAPPPAAAKALPKETKGLACRETDGRKA